MNRLSFQSFLPGSNGLLYDHLLVGTPDGASGVPHLWAGSSPGGILQGYGLRSTGAPLSDGNGRSVGGSGTVLLRDMDLADAQMTGSGGGALLSVTGMSGQIRLHPVATSGALSAGRAVTDGQGQALAASELELFRMDGQTYMVTSSAAREGLALYRMADGLVQAHLLQEVQDAPKTTLSGVSDLLSLELGGTRFVVSASASEDGLSVHAVTGDRLEFRDSLGARDGLWIDGLEDIALLEAGGQSFVIAGSAGCRRWTPSRPRGAASCWGGQRRRPGAGRAAAGRAAVPPPEPGPGHRLGHRACAGAGNGGHRRHAAGLCQRQHRAGCGAADPVVAGPWRGAHRHGRQRPADRRRGR